MLTLSAVYVNPSRHTLAVIDMLYTEMNRVAHKGGVSVLEQYISGGYYVNHQYVPSFTYSVNDLPSPREIADDFAAFLRNAPEGTKSAMLYVRSGGASIFYIFEAQ
jgi:hypothetical protein